MSTAIQRRKGTTTQHGTFTGLDGELTVDTTKKTVVVHDGTTVGGVPLARESDIATLSSLGLTSTASELNLLDGVTVTTAELNILDGVTATTAELNILDGVTSTAAELNYSDGVTSAIQTQLGLKSPLASPTFTGTATASAFSGDGSALTNVPSSASTITAVASGALANGDKVILKSDGKVEVVASTSFSESVPTGSAVTANSTDILYPVVATDPFDSSKFVFGTFGTSANSRPLILKVGTVSGSSITFGSEYTLTGAKGGGLAIEYDPHTQGKLLVVYTDDSNSDPAALIATIASNAISFGTVYSPTGTSDGYYHQLAFDPVNANKFVLAFGDPSQYASAVVGTISGTALSFGTAVDITAYMFAAGGNENQQRLDVKYFPSGGKFIVAYMKNADFYGKARIGTVTGTSISYGTEVTFQSTQVKNPQLDMVRFNDDGRAVVVYEHLPTAIIRSSAVRVLVASGTNIGVGDAYDISGAAQNDGKYPRVAVDPNSYTMVFHTAKSNTGWKPNITVGAIDATYDSISMGAPTQIVTDSLDNYWSLDFLSGGSNSGKFVFMYLDPSNSAKTTKTILGQTVATYNNLTADNYIGVSDAAYADTTTATVQVVGAIDDAQSGLTVGSKQYVQNDGSLSTTAASPSVYAGMALSATSLLIKG